MAELTPMLKQYFAIKKQYPEEIVLFRLGDFYEMFGEDAVVASKILEIVLTARNKGTENEMSMCGVPFHAVDNYLAKLIKAGKRVAICDQVSDPNLPGLVERQVSRVVSPGTTFDELTLNGKTVNNLVSIAFQENVWGVVFVDVTTGDFSFFETSDLQLLKSELFRQTYSEIIVEKKFSESTIFQENFGSAKNWHVYQSENFVKSLENFKEHFSVKNFDSYGLQENSPAWRSAINLFDYLKETQKSNLAHLNQLRRHNFAGRLTLDETTIRNLEIFQTNGSFSYQGSLLSVIDRTVTAMGGRFLRRLIVLPFGEKNILEQRLNHVEGFKNNPPLIRKIRSQLDQMADLPRILGKIGCRRANARDLVALRKSLQLIPFLAENLQAQSFFAGDYLQKLQTPLELEKFLTQSIMDEPSPVLTEGGMIRLGYNEELDKWREISQGGKDYLLDLQKREISRTGINSLKVKFNNVFGYYIEISKVNLGQVPDDYIRKQTLVNAERFITPELKEFEDKILQAEEQIKKIEFTLIQEVFEQTIKYFPQIQRNAEALAEIDVFSSLADLANDFGYVKPTINQEGIIAIKAGRHPVIERLTDKYIPNDLIMDHDSNEFILLTGPNMSGKSSYLRQNALICLLAHLGSFVPADEANISLLDRIFTRVGASDDLTRGVSTFMVEMQETANILNNATEKSFIILDEVGRGTSTADGLSLAGAISEYLCQKIKAKTIFATHYHELTEIITNFPKTKNYCVAVHENNGQVVFLHKIVIGASSQSYGLEVARLAGLPSSLLLSAEKFLQKISQTKNNNNVCLAQKALPIFTENVLSVETKEVLREIKESNLNNLAPIEVWQKVEKWQKILKKDKS